MTIGPAAALRSALIAAMLSARRQLILDPVTGVSGDLWIGALADLLDDPLAVLDRLPERLGLPEVSFELEKTPHGSHFQAHSTELVVLPLAELERRLDHVLGERGLAERARQALERRQAALDWPSPMESGDTLVDLAGGFLVWDALGRPDVLINGPVVIGQGPRELGIRLTESLISVIAGPYQLEMTTPTGAALLCELHNPRRRRGGQRIARGAGLSNYQLPDGRPDRLRLELRSGELAALSLAERDLAERFPRVNVRCPACGEEWLTVAYPVTSAGDRGVDPQLCSQCGAEGSLERP
jgi:hypothetical protein